MYIAKLALTTLFFLFLISAPAFAEQITINTDSVLEKQFLGIGVEFDPSYIEEPSEKTWAAIFQRLDFMRAKFIRVMIADNCTSSQLYKILDYAKARDITVMLGVWGNSKNYVALPLDNYVSCLKSLYSKGYNNIRYFNLVNEPNGDWMMPGSDTDRWDAWTDTITRFYTKLKETDLLNKISLSGTDASEEDDIRFTNPHSWLRRVLSNPSLSGLFGGYEYHIYARETGILNDDIEKGVALRQREINANDIKGQEKHLWVSEIGIKDGKDSACDKQINIATYQYGMDTADIMIQIIRGGGAGGIYWDLDDAMHHSNCGLKEWGLWNSQKDMAARPWFFSVSLLARLFPASSQTLAVPAANGIRIAAAKYANKNSYDLSIAVINQNDTNSDLDFVLAGSGISSSRQFNKYSYSESSYYQEAPSKVNYNGGKMQVSIPKHSIVFLTTSNPI